MKWKILIHDAFEEELLHFSEAVQDELMASARMLEKYGP
jgi:mRNA-degrading endonuclease RelE of RelBE toxin-antitoxin system